MKNIVALSVLAILAILAINVLAYTVSVSNQEKTLRISIEAKQLDNKNELDTMRKKISNVAQVSERSLDKLRDIVVSYADARNDDGDGQLMSWVQESVPNVDTSTMNQLINIITSSRDSFKMRQTELIDMNRTHKTLLSVFPSSLVLNYLNRSPINITIVTSTETENIFNSGKDDNMDVFNN